MTMGLLKNVELCDSSYRFISEQLCNCILIWVCFVVVFFLISPPNPLVLTTGFSTQSMHFVVNLLITFPNMVVEVIGVQQQFA